MKEATIAFKSRAVKNIKKGLKCPEHSASLAGRNVLLKGHGVSGMWMWVRQKPCVAVSDAVQKWPVPATESIGSAECGVDQTQALCVAAGGLSSCTVVLQKGTHPSGAGVLKDEGS